MQFLHLDNDTLYGCFFQQNGSEGIWVAPIFNRAFRYDTSPLRDFLLKPFVSSNAKELCIIALVSIAVLSDNLPERFHGKDGLTAGSALIEVFDAYREELALARPYICPSDLAAAMCGYAKDSGVVPPRRSSSC